MKKIVIVLVIILFVWKCGCSRDRNIVSTVDSSNTVSTKKLLAYNYAEDFVESKLKAPSTAEFPGVSEKINHIKSLGGDKYDIDSWVDSQNSFGVMIRSRFTCQIIFENGAVRAENLIIQK